MTTFPQYSVVIPAYNCADTIRTTLDSVLAQTVPPGEVLVVNDGSSDTTCEIVESYGSPVRLITQANAGPAAARNNGIRQSQFDWIALLDADDSWLPNKLEHQLPLCADEVGLINCSEFQEEVDYGPNGLDFATLWNHNSIGTSTVLLSKKAFNEVGGFEEDSKFICIEDFNLWLRILAAGYRVATVTEPLVNYTPAEGNLSSNYECVIKAELYNVDQLGKKLSLPAEMIRTKKAALYEEYAKAFFWKRNIPQARYYYRQLLKQRISINGLGYWLATFLPASLLNAKRPTTA